MSTAGFTHTTVKLTLHISRMGEGGVVTVLLLLKTGSKAPVIFCVFSQACLQRTDVKSYGEV